MQPLDSSGPGTRDVVVALQHAVGERALSEQLDKAFDTLVGALLIIQSVALDCIEKAFAIFGDACWTKMFKFALGPNTSKLTHEGIVDAVVLPRVLDEQNVKQ